MRHSRERRTRKHRQWSAHLVGSAVLFAACGGATTSTDTDPSGTESVPTPAATSPEPQAAPSTSSEPSAPSTTPAATAPVDTVADTDVDTVPSAEAPPEPDRTGLRVVTHPALGGIRMGLPDDLHFSSEGEMIILHRPEQDGQVVIARVSVTGMGLPISEIDDFVDVVAGGGAEVTAVDEVPAALFGAELVGFDIRFAESPPVQGMFPSRPSGFQSNVGWTPGPFASVWAGAVTDGVLVVGALADSAQGLEQAAELRDELVPFLSLTTPDGLPGPTPSTNDRVRTVGEAAPFTTPTVDPDGPPTLATSYSAVEPGPYQLANLPRLVSIDVADDWAVYPNSPGLVVFADPPLITTSYRNLLFQVGANAITGTNVGPTTNTETVEIPDLAALREYLATPPETLEVSNMADTTIGTTSALQFDLRVDPTATCQANSPCSYLLSGPSPDSLKWLDAGTIHRFWWIDEDGQPPIVISASTAEADEEWLDTKVQEFISQVNFG